jgi:2-haloacid dehalogenase
VKALLFDTFVTLVDWRTSLIKAFAELGRQKGWEPPWADLVDDWGAQYPAMMDRVRSGELPWTDLDGLHRMALTDLLPKFGLDALSSEEVDQITLFWHRLSAWPDSVPGLNRLKRKLTLGAVVER